MPSNLLSNVRQTKYSSYKELIFSISCFVKRLLQDKEMSFFPIFSSPPLANNIWYPRYAFLKTNIELSPRLSPLLYTTATFSVLKIMLGLTLFFSWLWRKGIRQETGKVGGAFVFPVLRLQSSMKPG